jgi:hypothetical protein
LPTAAFFKKVIQTAGKRVMCLYFCAVFQTNLTLDWDYSPADYTCYSYNRKYLPDRRIKPILECENIPKYYSVSNSST